MDTFRSKDEKGTSQYSKARLALVSKNPNTFLPMKPTMKERAVVSLGTTVQPSKIGLGRRKRTRRRAVRRRKTVRK